MIRALLHCTIILAIAAPALAQGPMMGGGMPDPSRMSGIPRPDGEVPKNTLTVRLIRNAMTNPIVDHPVELVDDKGKLVVTQKTDAAGRATFANLDPSITYNARAKDASGQEVVSQPVQLPPAVGVRLLLLFKSSEVGVPDGTARLDKALPGGTIQIDVKDEGGATAPGEIEVVLIRAEASGGNPTQETKKTQKGSATFAKQETGAQYGYLLQVIGQNGTKQSSPPFRLTDNVGMRAVFGLRAVTAMADTSALRLERGTHLLIELGDQSLSVIWVLQVDNPGATAVDPGPAGVRFAMPETAAQLSLGEEAPPGQAIDGKTVVLKGPINPGRTEARIFFLLPYKSDSVELSLPLPIPMVERAAIIEKVDGATVVSQGMQQESRELGGKPLWLMRGPAAAAGDRFTLKLTGLPVADRTGRNGAMALAVLMLIVGLAVAFSGADADTRLRDLIALEAERDRLFEEAAALDDSPALKQKLQRLAVIYKKLDES